MIGVVEQAVSYILAQPDGKTLHAISHGSRANSIHSSLDANDMLV